MTKIDGGIGRGGIDDFIIYQCLCFRDNSYQHVTHEGGHFKGLKEVTRKLEEGDEIDSSTMGIVEKFLKNFPPPTTRSARNLSEFPAELLQLIFFYLPLCDLKSAVLVCKRWKGVAENSKLWEDKKLVLEEGENMTLSCAVEVARRIKIQTIQAIGLSINQVKKVALAVA